MNDLDANFRILQARLAAVKPRSFGDKYFNWIMGALVGAILIGSLVVLGALVHQRNARNEWFMSECQQDHKEYECYAMLRGGRR